MGPSPPNQEIQLYSNQREKHLEKPLPSNEEAERAVLGSILLDNILIDLVSEKLLPEDFFSPINRRIYSAMLVLNEKPGRKIDPILIGEELKKEGSFESIGGVTTITNLTFGLPHFFNIEEYVIVIKDKSRIRQLIRLNNQSTLEALSEEDNIEALLEQAETRLFALRDLSVDQGFSHIGHLVTASVDKAHVVSTSGNILAGISTGFIDLDAMTLGLEKKDLIILAGRPSMGKTALGLTLAQNAGLRSDCVVAFFSLEMSKEQLSSRMVCSEARVNSQLYRIGQLDSGKWDRIEAARLEIQESRIFIDDTPGISPSYIRPRLRRLKSSQGKLDLVVIDYLQLMQDLRYIKFGTQTEMSKISSQLKGLAKEFDTPVVALSQLNRQPEGRKDHKPVMSDLRESGAIEQDADIVAFIYRDDYYNEASEIPGVAEIILAKQRNGPTGSVNLAFDKPTTRFSNYTSDF